MQTKCLIPIVTAVGLAAAAQADETREGTDSGYVFSGPHIEEWEDTLGSGIVLAPNWQKGVYVSENPDSPWHHATFLSQGTTVKNADGEVIGDVFILQAVDADGDVTWASGIQWYNENEGISRWNFLDGTGKWKGITGSGTALGSVRDRADDHNMPKWQIEWKVDAPD